MRGWGEIVFAIAASLATLIVVGLVATWLWLSFSDRRDCRRAGGTVVYPSGDYIDAEWHCVGATPEAK